MRHGSQPAGLLGKSTGLGLTDIEMFQEHRMGLALNTCSQLGDTARLKGATFASVSQRLASRKLS